MRRSDYEQFIRESWDCTSASGGCDKLFDGVEDCELGFRMWASDKSLNPHKKIQRLQE